MNGFTLLTGILVGGTATTLAVQLLKSKIIPVAFEKHPRWTAAAVSVIATVISMAQAGITVENIGTDWLTWIAMGAGTLLVATSTYNNLVTKPAAE